MIKGLNTEQLEQFDSDGYLIVHDVFSEDDLAPLINDITEATTEKAVELHQEGKLKSIPNNKAIDAYLKDIAEIDGQASAKITQHLYTTLQYGYKSKGLFNIVSHKKFLSMLESILGPEIITSVLLLRPKLPTRLEVKEHYPGVVGMHQDQGYFSKHCDNDLIVTCWIPMVQATEENGCLVVCPGVHKNEILFHQRHTDLVIHDEHIPTKERVLITIGPGSVLFLTNKTPHCSWENNTDVVRWSIDVRFQAGTTPNNLGQEPEYYRPDLPPMEISCNPPQADFLVKSKKYPEKVIKSWEELKKIRTNYHKGIDALTSSVNFKHNDVYREWPDASEEDKQKRPSFGPASPDSFRLSYSKSETKYPWSKN